jgi:hypothetical protein
MFDLQQESEHLARVSKHNIVKRKSMPSRKRKAFALNQKYYFVSLLTDFTKFMLESVDCIGFINNQINEIDELLNKYKIIKTSATIAKDSDMQPHIDSLQNSINSLEQRLNYKQKRLFHLITTSKKLEIDIMDFIYHTEDNKVKESIKETFEKVVNNNLNKKPKSENKFSNSNVEMANSIIEYSMYSIGNTKENYLLNSRQQLDNMYKELIDLKSSLEKKRAELDEAIATQLNSFQELFVTKNESPNIMESVLDTVTIRKRKDVVKRLLKVV